MTLRDYQLAAARTIPEGMSPDDLALTAALGLCGEAAEVLAAFLAPDPTGTERIAELGDVLWYCAALMTAFGADLEDVVGSQDPPLTLAREWRWHSDQLITAAGGIAELVKKHRFHGRTLHRSGVLTRIVAIVGAVRGLAAHVGSDIPAVCAANVEKLRLRHPDGFRVGVSS
jgi:NTP pyrophosphatase (non-canonical NTP hydrolase)